MNSKQKEQQREEVIQNVTEMLRHNPFTFEFKVKKNPQGIRVVYELTKDEMDALMKKEVERHKAGKDRP